MTLRPHRLRRQRSSAHAPRLRRNARDDRIVEEGRVALLVERLRLPRLSSFRLGAEELREPNGFLAGAESAELEVVVAEGEADAVGEETCSAKLVSSEEKRGKRKEEKEDEP